MALIIPVILAGGGGTRLWPRSREEFPKQFLPLISERSLLVETVLRTASDGFDAPIVACAAQYRFHVAGELEKTGIAPKAILIEPQGRNTGPATAAAALLAAELAGNDAVIALLAADHFIPDGAALRNTLKHAARVAKDYIVTLGLRPVRPETGYGYIEMGVPLPETGIFRVKRFVEKPDLATAQHFMKNGAVRWNASMFVGSAGLFLKEMAQHCPDILVAADASLRAAKRDPDFIRLDEAAFARAPAISIDYALMERTERAAVIPADFEWSDVGGWPALWQVDVKNGDGNVEKGDVLTLDCRNSFIQSEGGLVAAIGLDEMLVVQTPDATLVAPMGRAQDVREIVQRLKADKRREAAAHVYSERPWGSFRSLHNGAKHQVKQLVLKPGAAISLQLHHRRSEHWVVVKGSARVTVNDDVTVLGPNQTAYIPVQAKHRLENAGDEDLHVIEVQFGEYLGEDDIVRFEDRYRRV